MLEQEAAGIDCVRMGTAVQPLSSDGLPEGAVVDEPVTHGFTYATIPDHPECGYESFTVENVDGEVTFHVEAVSRPPTAITRFGAPIARELHRGAANHYLSAIERWTSGV